MPGKKHKTIGLALGSGAYRGFAHIGVLKSLKKNGIPIDYLSGCSIGAWVGAYYAVFQDTLTLERDLINNQKENFSLLLDLRGRGGIISGQKFMAYLSRKLNDSHFSDLKIPLQIVATDLSDGSPYIFKDGPVAPAVRASTAVPLVFKSWEQDGKFLADGGLSNPVPSDVVRRMGADIVIAVSLYNASEFVTPPVGISETITRSTLIMLHNLSAAGNAAADVVVEPDLSRWHKASSLSKYFTKSAADGMIAAGEAAMDKMIPALRRLMS
jgi:NTE family protein